MYILRILNGQSRILPMCLKVSELVSEHIERLEQNPRPRMRKSLKEQQTNVIFALGFQVAGGL